ncbi:unnamed protein product [Adineta steineri]|uniref:F-box domain-containing protein n=1 Tax=Adineta steineri TaxID=433720 RepID=A0A814EG40_9BILA|nr:unnamed protein product [Adineta steineri]CAF3867661.1 unnamed protein product [Adineta steineri]
MSFEISFPDEIILEICGYLHSTDVLLSFAGLNHRLNRTISDFIHHIHITSMISYRRYLALLQITLPSIWSSIQSLTIDNSQIPCLTTLFLNNTQDILPPNLKRLSLYHLNTYEIYTFINRLMNKCIVEELIIECLDTDYTYQQELYGYKIAQMLFYHHPTLKTIELRGAIIFDLSHLSFLSLSNSDESNLTSITNTDFSSVLRRLTIPLRSLSSLHLLLIYQPHLEYLNVHIDDAYSTYDYSIKPFPPLLNLREFYFHSEDLAIKFDTITELLKYFPNLKSLSLDITTECRRFFDGDILQTLVYSLDSFQFSIISCFRPTLEERTLSTFYTSFWLEIKKWYTQCYWHIDDEHLNSDYFHIYSVPFPFVNFDVYKCTNENLLTNEKLKIFSKVKQLDLSETSDINVIPFLKRCPNIHTISLNNIYDDEENYGTDEEEDIMDQTDDNNLDDNVQIINSYESSLPILRHVSCISLLALPEHDLGFFERIVYVTPNLKQLILYFEDLVEIIRIPQRTLCQILQKCISQLEINLDYVWTISDIRRDIPKILRVFSNIKSLSISLHPDQKRLLAIINELLLCILKHQTNLICLHIDSSSSIDSKQMKKQGGIEVIKTQLIQSCNTRLKQNNYQEDSVHIEFRSSSIVVWL